MESPMLQILENLNPQEFLDPIKEIKEGHDIPRFLMSRAYGDIMVFVTQLNRAMFPCRQPKQATEFPETQIWEIDSSNLSFSNTTARLRELLTALDQIINEVPPDPGPRRFGNVSFRKWYEKVEAQASELFERYLPVDILSFPTASDVKAIAEVQSYFLGSFGSSQRLDYGTGHELSFLAFLGCIWKLGGFEASSTGNEERGIVLGIIEPYLQLIRRLIKTYTLEPAGSHGVWGLDDHSFLPYLFGSAQFGPAISETDPTPIEGSRADAPDPADVAKVTAVERERKKNMYFSAIGFIYDVKKGPFWEHSPMLYDISGIRAGWGKINKGMIKMYMAEVLSKFPVVQHFYFGSLFSWEVDPHAATPAASVHTSNQPTKTDPLEKPSPDSDHHPKSIQQERSRRQPQNLNLPPPPGAFVGTAAPWAKKATAADPMTTAFPQQGPRSQQSTAPNPFSPTSTPASSASQARAMPPPTRAPWANEPDS